MIRWERVKVIIDKEWLELRRSRSLLAGMLLPPLLLPLFTLGLIFAMGIVSDPDTADIPAVAVDPTLANLSLEALAQVIFGRQFSVLFLLLPMIIPNVLASYSIVGEKNRRTLEPLLAAPITVSELLVGKVLAAVIPGILLTWLCATIFAIGLVLVVVDPVVPTLVFQPGWLIMLIFASPLLAAISVALTVMISSRVNDPRSAQQIAGVLIVPVMLLFFGQMLGLFVLDVMMGLNFSLVLSLLAIGLIWLAAKVFQREEILTRWR
ncbi:ABC transporter permease subunit [Chloroflexus sp. Y-396-1]|uniref:ABC transporter permease subunit n=1 Tax=Chloroflexus sp. Y-396-1 TaxID=867845 RepID=UPI00048F62CC|nr:ABC transporter permease subunit [Chloroflexus sp. Y-396-1]